MSRQGDTSLGNALLWRLNVSERQTLETTQLWVLCLLSSLFTAGLTLGQRLRTICSFRKLMPQTWDSEGWQGLCSQTFPKSSHSASQTKPGNSFGGFVVVVLGKMMWFVLFVYAHRQVHVRTGACVHTCPKVSLECHFSVTLHFGFWDSLSLWPRTQQLGYAGYLVCTRDPPASASPAGINNLMSPHPDSYAGSESKPKSSRGYNKHFADWALSPAPQCFFLKTSLKEKGTTNSASLLSVINLLLLNLAQ